MGFFSIDDDTLEWKASKNLWIYPVIAVPLTVMSLVYWKWRFG